MHTTWKHDRPQRTTADSLLQLLPRAVQVAQLPSWIDHHDCSSRPSAIESVAKRSEPPTSPPTSSFVCLFVCFLLRGVDGVFLLCCGNVFLPPAVICFMSRGRSALFSHLLMECFTESSLYNHHKGPILFRTCLASAGFESVDMFIPHKQMTPQGSVPIQAVHSCWLRVACFVFHSPDVNLCGSLGSKHQLTTLCSRGRCLP